MRRVSLNSLVDSENTITNRDSANAQQTAYDRRLAEHRWAFERSAVKWARDEARRKHERNPMRPFVVERDNYHDLPATAFANHDHLGTPVFIKYDHILELDADELKNMAKTNAQKLHSSAANEPGRAVQAVQTITSEAKVNKDVAEEASQSLPCGTANNVDTEEDAPSHASGAADNDVAKDAAESPRSAAVHDNSLGGDAKSPPLVWPGVRTFHEDRGPYERHHLREKAWAKHVIEHYSASPSSELFQNPLVSSTHACKILRGFPVEQGYWDHYDYEGAQNFPSTRSSSESPNKRVDSAIQPSSVEDGTQDLECPFKKSLVPHIITAIPTYVESSPPYHKNHSFQRSRRDSSLTLALQQPNKAGIKSVSHLHTVRNNCQDLTAMARRQQANPGYQVTFAQDGDHDNAIASDSEDDEDDDSSEISVVNEDWPITQASIEAVEKKSSYLEMAPKPCRKIPSQEKQESKKCKSVTWADTPRPMPFRSHTELTNAVTQPLRPSTIPAYARKQMPRSQPIMRGLDAPEPELPGFLARTESWQWNYVANAHGHSISELPPPWFTMPNALSARAISLSTGESSHVGWR